MNKQSKIKSFVLKLINRGEMSAIVPLIIILIIAYFVNPTFFKYANIMDILRTTSYSFIAAVPLTMSMITGDRDMSVGATTALGGIVCAWGLTLLGWSILPSVLLGLAAGVLIGIFKCIVLVKVKLPTFMITLGLQYIVNGFILVTTKGVSVVGFSDAFQKLGQGKIGGVYYTIFIALILGILAHFVLNYTRFGREIYATGGNIETARLAGINTNMVKIVLNIMTSVFAVATGMLYASRFNAASSTAGAGTEMTLMASIVIGGTANAGGVGTIFGTFCGCLLLSVIKNALVIMHISTYWQNLVFGGILIASLFIDKVRTERSRGGLK